LNFSDKIVYFISDNSFYAEEKRQLEINLYKKEKYLIKEAI
jgi:hypothetical protein